MRSWAARRDPVAWALTLLPSLGGFLPCPTPRPGGPTLAWIHHPSLPTLAVASLSTQRSAALTILGSRCPIPAHSLGKRSQIPQTSLVSPRQHRRCGGLGSGSSVCPGPTPSSPPRSLALRERECWAWAPGRKADSGRTGKALFPGFAVSALVWLMDKGPFQGREQLPTLLTPPLPSGLAGLSELGRLWALGAVLPLG